MSRNRGVNQVFHTIISFQWPTKMLQHHLQHLFVERMNLCAKLIVGEKRTRLNHELIDKLVTLCMNLKFMIYCRGEHALIGKVNEVQNDMGNDKDIYIDEYKY